MPANGRRIEQHLGPAERRQAGRLRIPLVPADQRPDARKSGVEAAKTEIARRKVILLEVQRVVGDVHLAIEAEQRSVRVDNDRRVVIDARGPAFEDRPYDDNAELARELREALARW